MNEMEPILARTGGFNRDVTSNPFEALKNCTCCPRQCRADRSSKKLGYCKTGLGFSIGSICAHRGEEPAISGKHGICNVFFTRCNMQCLYCQNYDISRTCGTIVEHNIELGDVIERIEAHLDEGCKAVGLVSPSHVLVQAKAIITALKTRGRNPVFVYNTNGYEKESAIRSLQGMIDVYLPDMKYMDAKLAGEYSDTPDYPEVAGKAIKEMYRQKKADIALDENGHVVSGMIIRHLVLPGHVENSKAVLRFIADELSTDVYISLMSQYYPTPAVAGHPKLGRCLKPDEYEEVLEEFERLGFHHGFMQELSSSHHYRPDFTQQHPFK
jgi:putative pyruvate formate lyase activating enzyme